MIFVLKKVREKKGVSQEELAKKAGISRTIVSGMETGSIETTTTATLSKLADALDCKITDLFLEK